jgi:hypothetical protein
MALVVAGLVVVAGCSDRKAGKPRPRKIEGIAEKIDLQNNYVSMRVPDGKGGERILEGTFREDTEVEINGRSGKLEHVRPGDKVVVYGNREGEGDDQKLVATKVVVTRPEGSDWKNTGKPSGKAGEVEPGASGQKPAAPPTTAPANTPGAAKAGRVGAEDVEEQRRHPARDGN